MGGGGFGGEIYGGGRRWDCGVHAYGDEDQTRTNHMVHSPSVVHQGAIDAVVQFQELGESYRQSHEARDEELLEYHAAGEDVQTEVCGLERFAEGHQTAAYLDDEGSRSGISAAVLVEGRKDLEDS